MREALLNENKVLFLDGGLATTLESFGLDLRNSLWSASALIERPELVAKAHLQFAQAGCDIVSTASYQLALQARPDDGEALLQRAVELARSSGARFVAGSMGSFGAYLADGSEYRGFAHEGGIEFLQNFHRRRAEILWKCGVSCLLFETIPCLDEARAVLQMLSDRHVVIVSFQCRDDEHLASGEVMFVCLCGLSVVERRSKKKFVDALELCRAFECCVGVGVNCVPANRAIALMRLAAGKLRSDQVLCAYPNVGREYDPATKDWCGKGTSTDELISHLRELVELGCRVVGGCCGVSPHDMEQIVKALREMNKA